MASKKKTPTPEPVEEAVGWDQPTEQVAEMEEDAKWDGSNDVPAVEPTTDDWNSVPPPAMHSQVFIKQHSGEFNSDEVKMLIYGESGSGKTRLASTFPDALFLDIDKGMASVTEQVSTIDIDNFRQLQEAYAYLRHEEHEYTTVVIDTLNEMQRLAMGATVEDFPQIRRSYENLPSMSDYGKMLHDMMELTRNFVHLPMRVVLLAQVNTRQFETDMLMPQLIGKNTSREIARKMDVIGYIAQSNVDDDNGKKLKEIHFDAQEYVTKDRSYCLPATLLAPTYERIAAFWS